MRKEVKSLVIVILKDYPSINKKLKSRKFELMHPIHKRDENVGGGRAINRPWTYYDDMLITIDKDRYMHRLKREKEAIDLALQDAGDCTQKIIKECYFNPNHKTIKNLVATGDIWCSTTKAYKLRDQFIVDVAKKLDLDVF